MSKVCRIYFSYKNNDNCCNWKGYVIADQRIVRHSALRCNSPTAMDQILETIVQQVARNAMSFYVANNNEEETIDDLVVKFVKDMKSGTTPFVVVTKKRVPKASSSAGSDREEKKHKRRHSNENDLCRAKVASGERCSRRHLDDKIFCKTHQEKSDASPEEFSKHGLFQMDNCGDSSAAESALTTSTNKRKRDEPISSGMSTVMKEVTKKKKIHAAATNFSQDDDDVVEDFQVKPKDDADPDIVVAGTSNSSKPIVQQKPDKPKPSVETVIKAPTTTKAIHNAFDLMEYKGQQYYVDRTANILYQRNSKGNLDSVGKLVRTPTSVEFVLDADHQVIEDDADDGNSEEEEDGGEFDANDFEDLF